MANLPNEKEVTQDYFSVEFPPIHRIIFRNKYLFCSFILIFTILGWLYALSKRPLYQGRFEIVVDINNQGSSGDSIFNNFTLGNKVSSLATEVGILESPSVLRPVYEYVMSEKRKIDPKFKEINFISWKDNFLKINLKPETSILKIIYRDNKKTLIQPVLEKISEAYQIYSGKTKKRKISLTKEYLSSQIVKFRSKSNKSLQIAQEYAIDNNLAFGQNTENSNESLANFGFKNRRLISDQIKKINFQINKINNLDESFNKLQYFGFIAPQEITSSLMDKLTKLEGKLIALKLTYKPDDKSILSVTKEKELTLKLLKEKTLGYLETEKLILQTKLDAIARPKEVVVQYKTLLREASRNEDTLVKLENQLQLTNLEAAKFEDPWELISDPYVDNSSIINKNIYVIFGIFAGGILGLLTSILKEKKSGFVYDEEILEKVFNCRIIQKLKLENQDFIEVANVLLKNILDKYEKDSVYFLIIGNENVLINQFLKNISLNYKNIKVEKKLLNILEADKLFILSSLESVKEKQIRYFAEQIKFMNINIEGIFLANIKVPETPLLEQIITLKNRMLKNFIGDKI